MGHDGGSHLSLLLVELLLLLSQFFARYPINDDHLNDHLVLQQPYTLVVNHVLRNHGQGVGVDWGYPRSDYIITGDPLQLSSCKMYFEVDAMLITLRIQPSLSLPDKELLIGKVASLTLRTLPAAIVLLPHPHDQLHHLHDMILFCSTSSPSPTPSTSSSSSLGTCRQCLDWIVGW